MEALLLGLFPQFSSVCGDSFLDGCGGGVVNALGIVMLLGMIVVEVFFIPLAAFEVKAIVLPPRLELVEGVITWDEA